MTTSVIFLEWNLDTERKAEACSFCMQIVFAICCNQKF